MAKSLRSYPSDWSEEDDANLIAAAPDLHYCLKRIVELERLIVISNRLQKETKGLGYWAARDAAVKLGLPIKP